MTHSLGFVYCTQDWPHKAMQSLTHDEIFHKILIATPEKEDCDFVLENSWVWRHRNLTVGPTYLLICFKRKHHISLKDENVSTVIHLSNSLLKLLAGLLLRKSVMQTRGFCWLVTMNSLQWSWEYLEDFLWQLLRMAETSSARCVQVSYYILGGMMIYWLTMWSRLQTRLLVIFKAL